MAWSTVAKVNCAADLSWLHHHLGPAQANTTLPAAGESTYDAPSTARAQANTTPPAAGESKQDAPSTARAHANTIATLPAAGESKQDAPISLGPGQHSPPSSWGNLNRMHLSLSELRSTQPYQQLGES